MTALTNSTGGTIDVPEMVVDDYLQQGWTRSGGLLEQTPEPDTVPASEPAEKPKTRSRRKPPA